MPLLWGMLMNVSMMGFYCTAASLAEEKEKNTLRTLMTSSVNGLEFFLGSLIPIVLMTEVRQCTLRLYRAYDHGPDAVDRLSGRHHSRFRHCLRNRNAPWNFFQESGYCEHTYYTRRACIYDDGSPCFTGFSETLQKISMFFFTGIAFDAIANIANGLPAVDVKGIAVLAAEFILSVILFLILYRRNGFER